LLSHSLLFCDLYFSIFLLVLLFFRQPLVGSFFILYYFCLSPSYSFLVLSFFHLVLAVLINRSIFPYLYCSFLVPFLSLFQIHNMHPLVYACIYLHFLFYCVFFMYLY
jgi:hypothetical protein